VGIIYFAVSQQAMRNGGSRNDGSRNDGSRNESSGGILEEGKVSCRDYSDCPRIIHRNMGFNQSRNSVYIRQKNALLKIWTLVQHDWFHAFLRIPTWKSLASLLSLWTLMIIIFAGIYMAVDREKPELNCGLGAAGSPIAFGPAFAFSLQTCTTGGLIHSLS
jgi:hypothetical protein